MTVDGNSIIRGGPLNLSTVLADDDLTAARNGLANSLARLANLPTGSA